MSGTFRSGRPLPAGTGQHGGDCRPQALVAVSDDQLDAAEAASHQRAQQGDPTGAVLAGHQVEAEHLPVAVGVHSGGDDHHDVDDAAASRTFMVSPSSHTWV